MAAFGISLASLAAMGNDFVTLVVTKDLDVPAQTAWNRIGDFCQVDKWSELRCTCKPGSGGAGTVRDIDFAGGKIEELMVAKTPLSYTYINLGESLPFYHGTMAVESVGAERSKIVYTFLWDQETLTTEQRQHEHDVRVKVFGTSLNKMKKLAEGR